MRTHLYGSSGTALGLALNADRILSDPKSQLTLPAIVLAEVCWIAQNKSVGLTIEQILSVLDDDHRVEILPLDREVIERSNSLTAIKEMHDRQIVATALLYAETGENAVLITHDQNISESGLVPVIW